MFIDAVTQRNNTKNTEQAYANIQVWPDKSIVCFKLDAGADTNVIPTHIFRSSGIQDALEPSLRPLYGYGGEELIVSGKCNIKCQYMDIQSTLKAHVVYTLAPPMLRLQACLDFGLIKFILPVSDTPEISILGEFV